MKHFKENIQMLKQIKKCDYAIDITAGDSFSDIYGEERFYALTKVKSIIQQLKVPLILGPQTYGPFLSTKNEKFAAKVMQRCLAIIARDSISAKVASSLSNKEVGYTTDLAFQLPYTIMLNTSDKIRIGLNISGLLVKEHIEKGIEDTIKLLTDYDEYIEGLLSRLCSDKMFEVHLISHVREDYVSCEKYHKMFPETIMSELFDNPIDIKNYIASMDIFIGARMHATIAAFSSGVITIPTAYSRKFDSMFKVVGYKRTIDLQIYNTEKSILMTMEYINARNEIAEEVEACLKKCEEYYIKTRTFFKDAIRLD